MIALSSPCCIQRIGLSLFVIFTTFLLLLVGQMGFAERSNAQFMFNPLRVIFTQKTRSIDVHVINNSDESVSYKIDFATMRVDEDGKFYEPELETEDEKYVKSLIRYSPRRATVGPKGRQVVKLMIRKPKDLPAGEYKTRLRFTPLPKGVANTGKMINIEMIVASTIPVVIQHGLKPSEVSPQSIALRSLPQVPSGLGAEVKFTRTGKLSTFGDVFLSYFPTDKPKSIREIGRSIGMAIYLPDNKRTITIPLAGITRSELKSGTIRISYQHNTGVVSSRRSVKQPVTIRDFTIK